MLNVYRMAFNSSIYGPGKRTVIWFRGCSIRCKNCINPELWKRISSCDRTVEEVMSSIKNDEVTFLGGEPLDQEDIEELIDLLKKSNKGIILFTGYSIKEFDERKKRIVSKCDAVISEPFIEKFKDDSLYLRGSTNQIITINSRYNEIDFKKPNIIEVSVRDSNIQSFGRNKNILTDLLGL